MQFTIFINYICYTCISVDGDLISHRKVRAIGWGKIKSTTYKPFPCKIMSASAVHIHIYHLCFSPPLLHAVRWSWSARYILISSSVEYPRVYIRIYRRLNLAAGNHIGKRNSSLRRAKLPT